MFMHHCVHRVLITDLPSVISVWFETHTSGSHIRDSQHRPMFSKRRGSLLGNWLGQSSATMIMHQDHSSRHSPLQKPGKIMKLKYRDTKLICSS